MIGVVKEKSEKGIFILLIIEETPNTPQEMNKFSEASPVKIDTFEIQQSNNNGIYNEYRKVVDENGNQIDSIPKN